MSFSSLFRMPRALKFKKSPRKTKQPRLFLAVEFLEERVLPAVALPPYLLLSDCSCSCNDPGDLVAPQRGLATAPAGVSSNPVRYFDGVVKIVGRDLESDGYGIPWGQTRSWTNGVGYPVNTTNGTGWVVTQQPYLEQSDTGVIAAISNGTTARFFDLVGGVYQARAYYQDQLTYDNTNHDFVLTDSAGDKIRFYDFTNYPSAQQGQFESYTDPAGNVVSVTGHTMNGTPGQIADVQRSFTDGSGTTTDWYHYTYLGGGTLGLLSNVKLQRSVSGGAFSIVRQVDYTYYADGEAHGNPGDLKTAVIKDAGGNALDTSYYRYYVSALEGTATGYQHALKYVFNTASYGRLTVGGTVDPSSISDDTAKAYADNYFEYDSPQTQRASKEIAQGAGCSTCSGGLGTFSFTYTTSTFAVDYNSWKVKTIETLPDNVNNR